MKQFTHFNRLCHLFDVDSKALGLQCYGGYYLKFLLTCGLLLPDVIIVEIAFGF